MVANSEQTVSVPAMPVGEVVDTTGAGDLFAAGYALGKSTGADILERSRICQYLRRRDYLPFWRLPTVRSERAYFLATK